MPCEPSPTIAPISLVVGAAEAPLSDIVRRAFQAGHTSAVSEATDLTNGAGFVVVESQASATRRQCKPYATVLGMGHHRDAEVALRTCLQAAQCDASSVELVIADEHSDPINHALMCVASSGGTKRWCSDKTVGNTLASTMGIDLGLACLSFGLQTSPSSMFTYDGYRRLLPEARKNILLMRGDGPRGGQHACILLGRASAQMGGET